MFNSRRCRGSKSSISKSSRGGCRPCQRSRKTCRHSRTTGWPSVPELRMKSKSIRFFLSSLARLKLRVLKIWSDRSRGSMLSMLESCRSFPNKPKLRPKKTYLASSATSQPRTPASKTKPKSRRTSSGTLSRRTLKLNLTTTPARKNSESAASL